MENIKCLEKQKRELDKKIRQYYIDEEKERVKKNEEEYVGKCYKVVDGGTTLYFKFISGLTSNTYNYMHRMAFKLPIDLEFKPVLRMHCESKFEYEFYGDYLEFADTLINPIEQNNRIEISIEEFEEALIEFGKQLLEISREDFTVNGKHFIK